MEQHTVVTPAPAGETPLKGSHPKIGQRPSTKTKVPWGPLASILYTSLVYYISQYAALLLLVGFTLGLGWNRVSTANWLTSSVVAQFFYVLFAEAFTFGATWWFIHYRKSNLRAIGWQKYRWWFPVAAIAAYAVYAICYGIVLSITTHADPSLNIHQKQDLGFQNVSGSLGLALTFVSLVVLPPIVEETVFRGFVFTGLRTKLKWIWAALITSLLFASAHLLEGGSGQPLLWVAGLDTFTLSMVLCFLRQKTDSLWPGVFLHALKNGVAFVSLFILHIS